MTMTETLEAWIEGRGLDPELAVRMGWESARTADGAEWVKIPYVRDGKVINHKYRKLAEKTFRNDTGSEHDLWNIDCLKDETLANEPLVICEGEMDALAVMQCGFQRVVSIPDGWTANLENEDGQPKFEVFKRNEALIRSAAIVIAATDADETGHSLLRAAANFFDGVDVRYPEYPEGCKDPNDVIAKGGAEALVKSLNRARRVDPPGGMITGFSDLPPRPARSCWKLDYPNLERLIAFRTREISVLTGVPGSGKSTFMTWLCHHLVRIHDIRVGVASFETEPEELFQHLAKLRGGWALTDMGSTEAMKLRAELDRNFRLVHRVEDDETTHGMGWLKNIIHTLAARDGCNLIVIDPWNELEHLPEPGESVAAYTNFALMRLRQWADRYDIHICIVAHPRKMEEGKKPLGYHIADAAAWANKPRMGWTIHPEETEALGEHVTLTAWKVSHRQATGCAPGMTRMHFDTQVMTYRAAR